MEEHFAAKVPHSPWKTDVTFINDNPVLIAQPLTVVRATTTRVLAPPETNGSNVQMIKVKEEQQDDVVCLGSSEVVMETQMEEELKAEELVKQKLEQNDVVYLGSSELVTENDDVEVLKVNPFQGFNLRKPAKSKSEASVKKERVEEKILNLEDGDFPEQPEWLLMGRKVEVATTIH